MSKNTSEKLYGIRLMKQYRTHNMNKYVNPKFAITVTDAAI